VSSPNPPPFRSLPEERRVHGVFACIFTSISTDDFPCGCTRTLSHDGRLVRFSMRVHSTIFDGHNDAAAPRVLPVRIATWVNERCPPLSEILSAHDVARLTRRPRWVLTGLCLIGRFPKRLQLRGRKIGWRRAEVLDWMAQGAVRDSAIPTHMGRRCSGGHQRQACLRFEYEAPCRRQQSRLPCSARAAMNGRPTASRTQVG